MRIKEKVYLGHPNLKRLLSSVPFRNFLLDKYKANKNGDWCSALSEGINKYLRADLTPDKIRGAFQQSKRCNSEVAKQIIAIAEVYKDTELSKHVNWRNYDIEYHESRDVFKNYFRQFKLELSKEPIDQTLLDGVWTVYTSTDTCIFRSFLDIDLDSGLNIYRIAEKKGHLTYCDIESNVTNNSIQIRGDLEGTQWHYELQGRFDRVKNGKIYLIRGFVTIKNRKQLKVTPVLLWKVNALKRDIQSLDSSLWGRINGFNTTDEYSQVYEKSLLIYYQYLTENSSKVYDPKPVKNLRSWIKEYLKTRGRTRFDHYQQLLTSKKWISLSRQSNDQDKIRIYYWSFTFHPFKQAIIAKRVMRDGEYSETIYEGEMKYHNDRFWVEFDSGGHQKKIMLLRSTENTYSNGLYFLAMGSASFISFSNDPGDMLTEIVCPLDNLPLVHQKRYGLTYNEFKELTRIPLDLRLYLNHRDRAILSFDNPNSVKSSLQKQMAATAYSGKYLVYVYHRLLKEPFRLSRFVLEIDKLAVTVLHKADLALQDNVHTYHGLAEESHKNLLIALKHLGGTPTATRKPFSLQTRIIIDSSRGYQKRDMMTGIMSEADKDSKPMGMPCLLVRIDNYTKDFADYTSDFETILNKTSNLPLAHCLLGSTEYSLIEELLWTRKKTFLESRFAKHMTEKKLSKIGFLQTYFEIIGGVFYSDYTKENIKIEKLLGTPRDK